MARKAFGNKIKNFFYKQLETNAEKNIGSLLTLIKEDVDDNKMQVVREYIAVIKYMIKDKIPSKPKFYALLILKELMELENREIVDYFVKKMINRLFYIAQFESKNKKDTKRGERCLKKYYNQDSNENREYSLKFFILLLECWQHWSDKYGESNKKINQKSEKLRTLFPQTDIYYNYLDNLSGLQQGSIRDSVLNSIQKKPLDEESINRYERSNRRDNSNLYNSYNSHNHSLNESVLNPDEVSKQLDQLKSSKEVLFMVIEGGSEEGEGETLKVLYDSLSKQQPFFAKIKEKARENRNLSESIKNEISNKSKEIDDIINMFDKYNRGEFDFKVFQEKMMVLNRKMNRQPTDRTPSTNKHQLDQFPTVTSNNNSELHKSHKKPSFMDVSYKKSNKEISMISRNSDKKDRSGSKGNRSFNNNLSISKEKSGFMGSGEKQFGDMDYTDDIIMEQDEEDNFETFGDFRKEEEKNKDNHFTFKEGKEEKEVVWGDENDFGKGMDDFNDFNETNNAPETYLEDQMQTIDEESKEDYDSKINQSRFRAESKLTGLEVSKDQSFKINENADQKSADFEIKMDNFGDFNFGNFNKDDSTMKKSRKESFDPNFTKTDKKGVNESVGGGLKDSVEKEKLRNSEKYSRKNSKFSKSKKRKRSDVKREQTSNNDDYEEDSIKNMFLKDSKPDIDDQEEETESNRMDTINKNLAEKEPGFNSDFGFGNFEEKKNAFNPSAHFPEDKEEEGFDRYNREEKESDDEFKSFEQNSPLKGSKKKDPFSQFQVTDRTEEDNQPTLKNKMTFGHEDFENANNPQINTREEREESASENEDYEFDLKDNGSDRRSENAIDEEDDQNFTEPNFASSIGEKLHGMTDQFDNRGVSAYSDNRKSVLVQKVEDELESPKRTKVVKLPLITERTERTKTEHSDHRVSTEFINIRESFGGERISVRGNSRKNLQNFEKEMVELKTQKEHYKQQCDFLFNKLLVHQKDVRRGKINNFEDKSIITANVVEEDEFEEFHKKTINRKNDFLIRENQMLKKVNKELVENSKSAKSKKEMENEVLKKLVNEMESYVEELNVTLGGLKRSGEVKEHTQHSLRRRVRREDT